MTHNQNEKREGGIMFKNDRKSNDKQPDWRGELTHQGKTYDLAAWEKPTRTGGKFLSVKVSEPRPKQESNTDSLPF